MRVKERRESRRTSAEESGPCQQLPPSRKKKWQLPWLDGAYETIIPPPYLVLYVWTSSVQREGDGWGAGCYVWKGREEERVKGRSMRKKGQGREKERKREGGRVKKKEKQRINGVSPTAP